LQFVDCIFDFSVEQPAPTLEAQQLTKMLLAQNASTLTLPLAAQSRAQ
jgi:hypothetical protein